MALQHIVYQIVTMPSARDWTQNDIHNQDFIKLCNTLGNFEIEYKFLVNIRH